MNLRSKSVGIISALALSITMGTGIASADSSSTSATLANATPGNGCVVSITAGNSINFGTFEWDGSAYTGSAIPGSITVSRTDDRAPGSSACAAAQVSATDLTSGGNTAFHATDISLEVTGGSGPKGLTTLPSNYADLAMGTTVASVTLAGVPDSVPTGTYTGTITVSQAAGQ